MSALARIFTGARELDPVAFCMTHPEETPRLEAFFARQRGQLDAFASGGLPALFAFLVGEQPRATLAHLLGDYAPTASLSLMNGLSNHYSGALPQEDPNMLTTEERQIARLTGKTDEWMLSARDEFAATRTADGRGSIIDNGIARDSQGTTLTQIQERI